MLVLPVMMWYAIFGVMDRNYDVALKDVENIVSTYTTIAAKKGMMHKTILDEMSNELRIYGSCDIYITAKKYEGGGPPTLLHGYAVVDTDLRSQGYDLISIQVLYRKPHPITALHNITVFFTPKENAHEFFLFGSSTIYIR